MNKYNIDNLLLDVRYEIKKTLTINLLFNKTLNPQVAVRLC